MRDLIRDICTQHQVKIMKGHVAKDHVHLFVSIPSQVTAGRKRIVTQESDRPPDSSKTRDWAAQGSAHSGHLTFPEAGAAGSGARSPARMALPRRRPAGTL